MAKISTHSKSHIALSISIGETLAMVDSLIDQRHHHHKNKRNVGGGPISIFPCSRTNLARIERNNVRQTVVSIMIRQMKRRAAYSVYSELTYRYTS